MIPKSSSARTSAEAANSTLDWPRVALRFVPTELPAPQDLERHDRGRPKQDHPQRREDASEHRDEHLQRSLRAALLCAQQTFVAYLVGLDPQDPAHARPQLLRLNDRLDEVVQLLDTGALAHVVERLQPGPSEPDLLHDPAELAGKRVLVFLHHRLDRRIECSNHRPSRVRAGRTTRSPNGCWSSISAMEGGAPVSYTRRRPSTTSALLGAAGERLITVANTPTAASIPSAIAT